MSGSSRFNVFISYSHLDTGYKNELVNVLCLLADSVNVLSDDLLVAGDNWNEKLPAMREDADMFLLLVSNHYLASNTVAAELAHIFELHTDKGSRIIPFILEPCNWKQASFSRFQALPKFGKPFSEYKQKKIAFQELTDYVSSVVQLRTNTSAQSILKIEQEQQTGSLRLSGLELTYIPADLLDMPWLQELFLDDNYLSKINNLDNLTQLQYLSLEHNQLTRIENIGQLTLLKTLKIAYNKIEKIENLEGLVNLTELDLHHNRIKQLDNLDQNVKLEFLGLSSNDIDELENISHLQNLVSLYVAHNQLKNINALQGLDNLRRIVLTNNRIHSLKPVLEHIKRGLNVLLEYSFRDKEEGIYLRHNLALSEPSLEVVEKGREAILRYFEDADAHGTRKLQFIKLILVGNSRVGKTNLSEFLRKGVITLKSVSTHILEIHNWNTSFLKFEDATEMQVNIFDFGGQDYYHDSHQLYYTHDTAYVLLWDQLTNAYSVETEPISGTNEVFEYENHPLEYWLESIKYNLTGKQKAHFKGDDVNHSQEANLVNPVLILQNKIDLGEGRLNQKTLTETYQNIWGFFSVSLAKKKRTAIINEVLSDYLNSLNLSGRQLIRFEMEIVMHHIQHEAAFSVLTLADFYKDCKEMINDDSIRFNEDNASIIAQILNNLGILLYDKNSGGTDLVYTNISKLNELIREIMNIAKTGNDKGIFTRKQVAKVPHSDKVLQLLTKNNSIIRINDGAYLAPQFLPSRPDSAIEFFLNAFTYTQMRFVYKAYFQKSLLLNLFARYLTDTKVDTSDGVKRFPFWRNGIIVSEGDGVDQQMVYVEFLKDKDYGIVNIKTIQPFNGGGLEKRIENTLDELNQGLTVDKQISVNGTEFFSLDFLRKQAGDRQFEFYQNGKAFGINEFKHIAGFEKLPKRLFISYSSKDAEFMKRFATHLEILKSTGIVEPWYDRMIESGTRWDDAIRTEMNNADIIIFLLSPDFIATEYIMKTEIPLAISRMKKKKANFFFVQLLPCSWDRTELANYQQTDDATETKKEVLTITLPSNDRQWKKVVDELVVKIGS